MFAKNIRTFGHVAKRFVISTNRGCSKLNRNLLSLSQNSRVFCNAIHAREMSSLLIDDAKYAWLKDLGLQSENSGVFHGSWTGNGNVISFFLPLNIFEGHYFLRRFLILFI